MLIPILVQVVESVVEMERSNRVLEINVDAGKFVGGIFDHGAKGWPRTVGHAPRPCKYLDLP